MAYKEKLIKTKAEKAAAKTSNKQTNEPKIKALTHTVIVIRLQGAVGVEVWNIKEKKSREMKTPEHKKHRP